MSPTDDVMSSPWQRDGAGESMMMMTLKPVMIPTVVESERVTDDDDEWHRYDVESPWQPPVAATVHQHCVDHLHLHAADTGTHCHDVQQGRVFLCSVAIIYSFLFYSMQQIMKDDDQRLRAFEIRCCKRISSSEMARSRITVQRKETLLWTQ